MNDRLMTRKEIMQQYGIRASAETWWEWQKKGVLTPIRISREVQYRQSEVQSFFDSLGRASRGQDR